MHTSLLEDSTLTLYLIPCEWAVLFSHACLSISCARLHEHHGRGSSILVLKHRQPTLSFLTLAPPAFFLFAILLFFSFHQSHAPIKGRKKRGERPLQNRPKTKSLGATRPPAEPNRRYNFGRCSPTQSPKSSQGSQFS